MNPQKRKLATAAIVMAATITGLAVNTNSQENKPQISRIRPLVEERIEPAALTTIFDAGTAKLDVKDMIEGMKGVEQQSIIPQPKEVKADVVQAQENSTGSNKDFAKRVLRVGDCIKYYQFDLTLLRISAKTISAFFVISAGEDEWNFWLKAGEANTVRYNDHDNERSYDLIVRVDRIVPGPDGLPVVEISLKRKRIQPGQVADQASVPTD